MDSVSISARHSAYNIESKVVKLSDAQNFVKDVMNLMASQGSQISTLWSC